MAILIIEDEKNMSDLLKLELTHAGYCCDQAYDGEVGLKKALEQEYELILLDLMLPRINGIEVCRRLREIKQTPVIMLTARDEVMDKVNGSCGSCCKPRPRSWPDAPEGNGSTG